MTLRACRFTFDAGNDYPGLTDDTRWNGWLNVWVTPETAHTIDADMMNEDTPSLFDDRPVDVDGPHTGLMCLGWGYATREVYECA
jgi:hypothetical protein